MTQRKSAPAASPSAQPGAGKPTRPPLPPTPAECASPADAPKTDQEMLDESLQETFPASDPISPGGVDHTPRPATSDRQAPPAGKPADTSADQPPEDPAPTRTPGP